MQTLMAWAAYKGGEVTEAVTRLSGLAKAPVDGSDPQLARANVALAVRGVPLSLLIIVSPSFSCCFWRGGALFVDAYVA